MNRNPFKVGDVVELDMNCFDKKDSVGLKDYKIFPENDYVVEQVTEYYVYLKDIKISGWDWQRFKLVEKKMTQFKVGDVVRLDSEYDGNVEIEGFSLRFDCDYCVNDVVNHHIYLEGIYGGWLPERFKLVETKKLTDITKFTHERFNQLVNETFDKINKLSKLKGGEYAGDVDRLENFRRNGKRLDLPMEAIWHTYIAKHWDAVEQYIKDLIKGKTRERMEPLDGRLDDMILYCLLFKAMLLEKDDKKA